MLWVFEPQLLTLHPPHRHDGNWCGPIRGDSKYLWDHANWNVHTLLADLFSPELGTVEALAQEFRFSGGDKGAVDFSNLTDPMVAVKQTIEFRLHAGTLDGDEVVMWVKTVVGLVQWARSVDLSRFNSVMEYGEMGNDKFGVVRLLDMLGLREQAEFYKGRLHPLGVREEDAGKEYESQDLARPRMDVLKEFGIGEDGVATKNHWEEDLVFDPITEGLSIREWRGRS